ncbi:hypothetical protein SAMD00079811_83150 (plasmid) [Scytonema sp. HK-05]|uniref:hypothetical protein n=1 Tax=Scytonema sp. HK-05 TaxID=1137095 RepID=UPI000936A961|nr:hypothetical protein [Scytonema sp. HK-05]OKH44717.1 hypothetical protein NIES2130_37810 [Scytonema sp. HK-05]BAY50684.1 hypothetical protein SAMD00079811_83150 [Scytonema sp. HK-05]
MMLCNYCKQSINGSYVTYGLVAGWDDGLFCIMAKEGRKYYHKGACSRAAASVWNNLHGAGWCWR